MYAMDYKQVGSNIKKELDVRGMTQQSLADQLNVSKQVMNKIVNGAKAINVNELAQIASVLGVTADTLLTVETEGTSMSGISFMGKIKNKASLEKINFIRSAIDDIYFLEGLLND